MMNFKKILNNKNLFHLIISALVIIADLTLVFFLSLLQFKFDFSKVISVEFWIKYAITTFITIIPFFVLYNTAKQNAQNNEEIKEEKKKMQKNKDVITENFLDKEFDDWIVKTNEIEKCREYVIFLDKQINKTKLAEEKEKLLIEKNKTLAYLNLTREKIDTFAKLTEEKREEYLELTKDFSLGAIEFKKYTQISRGVVSLNFRTNQKKKIGEIADKKQLVLDVAIKLTLSTLGTLLLYAIGFDATLSGMQVIYDIIWRISMCLINAYMGFLEGIEIQINSKLEVFKEVVDVQNKFLNFCQSFGILKKI